MSVLCWKISPAPKHTHLDTNDNLARLTCIKLLFFTHEPPSLQQVSEITWAWGPKHSNQNAGSWHPHTHTRVTLKSRKERPFVWLGSSNKSPDLHKFKQRWHVQMCADLNSHTPHFYVSFDLFSGTHTDIFRSCALITSSRLILGQRRTQLTTDYWLARLVTVISCRVIWYWPYSSQTAANLAALEVIILFTLRRAGGDECGKIALLI